MLIRLAYSKIIRPNQGTFTTSTPITTHVVGDNVDIIPAGAAGTAAPSTTVFDRTSKMSYFLNKPYSAVYAQLTAATSDAAPINLV